MDKKAVDTGMAGTLIALIVWCITRQAFAVYAAMAVLVVTMTMPKLLRVPATYWFLLSDKMGKVVSLLLLGAIYCLIVIPVAFVQKLLKRDVMRLHAFKKDTASMFISREHAYLREDIKNQF